MFLPKTSDNFYPKMFQYSQTKTCSRRQNVSITPCRILFIIIRIELSMNENTKKPQTETMLNLLEMSEICYKI